MRSNIGMSPNISSHTNQGRGSVGLPSLGLGWYRQQGCGKEGGERRRLMNGVRREGEGRGRPGPRDRQAPLAPLRKLHKRKQFAKVVKLPVSYFSAKRKNESHGNSY